MQFVAPDILAESRGLPVALSGTGVGLGLLLWALGWRLHRFWIVLATTVVAGVYGLASGTAPGVQPLVVALLLAVAAGVLALPLARVIAFAAAGLAGRLAVHALAPGWDEPLLCFLAGGLVGLFLFRSCTMALTSLLGTLLMVHAGLCLADQLGTLDGVAWAEAHVGLLNWGCAGLALTGWVVQFLEARWRAQKEQQRREQEAQKRAKEKEKEKERERLKASRKLSVWHHLGFRRAG
jgi:signal transduction histidine kinase